MNLLEIYKERNKNPGWFDDHFSSSKNASGKMFVYTGTNFRSQESFVEQFLTFLEIEGKPRKFWPKKETTGQEMHKQHVTNMLQSKLFKKDVGDDEVYSRTKKGLLYNDFIKCDIVGEERWLINYLFLINGYFSNRKNYIIYRVKEDLLGFLLSVPNINVGLLIEQAKILIDLGEESLSILLRTQFFYIHSFYNDTDFLINYFRASEKEKEELAGYIEDNYKNDNLECCISKKYKSTVSTKSSLLDEAKVFLLTLLFIESKNVSSLNIGEKFIEEFDKSIFHLDRDLIINYLNSNKNVFGPIFEDILEIEDIDVLADIPRMVAVEIPSIDKPEDYIDETSEPGK